MEDNNNYQIIMNDLENKIKNNFFESKESLNTYLVNLKNNVFPQEVLTDEKILEYLNLYDEYNQKEEASLNMENYKGVSLENKNLIVATQTDEILKTNNSNEELAKEFKQYQNELTSVAQGTDSLANADEVYEHLSNNIKEEVTLYPINEVVNEEDIDIEMLNKIKFLISNEYINPYEYQVSLEEELFYNTETKEVLEVRTNEQTGKYDIYIGGEIKYQNEEQYEKSSENINFEKELDKDEEEKAYNNKNVKRLIRTPRNDNAAFVKTSFLIIAISFLSVIIATIMVLNK